MRALLILLILGTSIFAAFGEEKTFSEEPYLTITHVEAKLDKGRVDEVRIWLQNEGIAYNLSSSPQREGYEFGNGSAALAIQAELMTTESYVKVLSGKQLGGSLSKGLVLDNPLEFMAEVDPEAEVGVYPMELRLDYQRLSRVLILGDPGFPEVHFHYENRSQSLPVQVQVVEGPKLSAEVEGGLHPGREAEVELRVSNLGDEPAMETMAELSAQPPFSYSGETVELGDIAPGGVGSARLKIMTTEDSTPGEHALSFVLHYKDGNTKRQEDQAALVEVGSGEGGIGLTVPLLSVLFLALAAVGVYAAMSKISLRGLKRRW